MKGMSNIYNYRQPGSYYVEPPQHNFSNVNTDDSAYHSSELISTPTSTSSFSKIELKDYGPTPFVINIEEATKQNDNFRTALWTGNHLQLTLMSIPVKGEIGLEIHPNLDQFIRIEEGQGLVKMGDKKDFLEFQEKVYDDYAFIIPAGKWHNLMNTGNKPIKLYSIYAPPQHPYGTVHITKEQAEAEEKEHIYNNEKEQITPANNHFGAQASKLDTDLTLTDMLIYAIQDEFLAKKRYLLAMEKFGSQRPFINIYSAEENHIRYLMPLFKKYNVELPTDKSNEYVKIPANIKESIKDGIQGEVENIAMYERFLKENIPGDVKTIFNFLRNASKNHLQAFQRTLANTKG